MLTIKFDPKRMAGRLNDIQKKKIPVATRDAINSTASRLETQLLRLVSGKTGVSRKMLKSRFDKYGNPKGKRFELTKATINKLWSTTHVYKNGIPVMQTGARQTKTGVVASGGRYRFNSAFINAVKSSGQRHVMKRVGKERYPLRVLKINVAEMISRDSESLFKSDMKPYLRKEFNRRLSVLLQQR